MLQLLILECSSLCASPNCGYLLLFMLGTLNLCAYVVLIFVNPSFLTFSTFVGLSGYFFFCWGRGSSGNCWIEYIIVSIIYIVYSALHRSSDFFSCIFSYVVIVISDLQFISIIFFPCSHDCPSLQESSWSFEEPNLVQDYNDAWEAFGGGQNLLFMDRIQNSLFLCYLLALSGFACW